MKTKIALKTALSRDDLFPPAFNGQNGVGPCREGVRFMRMSKPCLIAVFAAVMAMGVCASDPDGLPYWFEYGGAITPPEANAAGENACEFKSPDGKELCRLGLSLISTRKTVLTFSRDGGKTWDATVAAPVGMTGYNPAAKSLGDGRVMIAYADPTKCDSKVYRHRACAWIGPWASLRAGSGRGFYRVLYTCGKEGEVGFPEVAETDAQFAKFAAASKDANGFGARPLWVDLTKDGKIRDHNQPLNPARYSVVCASDKYDAHPTTVMLPDEKTIFCFWDLAHGGPLGPAAKSTDAGRTWTRIDDQIPEQLKKLHDAPVAFRFIDPKSGKARIRVFAGYEHIDDKNWRGEKDRLLLEAMPSIISGDFLLSNADEQGGNMDIRIEGGRFRHAH